MKILELTISQIVGYLIIVYGAFDFTNYIRMYYKMENYVFWIIYLSLYFIGVWILERIQNVSFAFTCNKKFSIAIFLLILVFIFDIGKHYKELKINFILKSNNNLDTIQKYFDDKDEFIQYYSLYVYACNVDKNVVLNWFEEKYIRKSLPIESYFYPIYKDCIGE